MRLSVYLLLMLLALGSAAALVSSEPVREARNVPWAI